MKLARKGSEGHRESLARKERMELLGLKGHRVRLGSQALPAHLGQQGHRELQGQQGQQVRTAQTLRCLAHKAHQGQPVDFHPRAHRVAHRVLRWKFWSSTHQADRRRCSSASSNREEAK